MLFEQINDEGWARAYLIVDEDAALAVLVDPVLEFMTRDEEMLKRNGWSLACVMNTHTHADHVSSAVHLARKYDCPYLMHSSTSVPCAGLLVSDLEEHSFGALRFRFHHTPGHTSDAMCIEIENKLMTGDFLFNGTNGGGRDDLPTGDLEDHWASLQVLSRFSEGIFICPGHDPPGAPELTLEENRETNPVLISSSFEDYVRWQRATWEVLGEVSRMKYALPANLTCELPEQDYFADQ